MNASKKSVDSVLGEGEPVMDDAEAKDKSCEKAALRARCKAITVSSADDSSVCAQLESLPELESVRCVLAYLALPDEVNLDAWISWLIESGAQVSVPRVDWKVKSMVPVRLVGMGAWESGRNGLREPVAEAPVMPIQEIGAAIVPGLGFDADGFRLGRGGGFYDRFLAEAPQAMKRIGVTCQARVLPRVPREVWDQSVDVLVTETGVRRFIRLQG